MRKKLFCLVLMIGLAICPGFSACAKTGTGVDKGADASTNANANAGANTNAKAAATEKAAKDLAVAALSKRMDEPRDSVWVYRDFGVTENHFTQKAKMFGKDGELVKDMNENWRGDPDAETLVKPFEGDSCIRCEQVTVRGDWGGWLFLNGFLPKGETVPHLNDGKSDGQGIDLSGAEELRFAARGENGGEEVEFFTAGFGYDGQTGERKAKFADSAKKQSLGTVVLGKEWKEYSIPLEGADMSYIVCGFGYVLKAGIGDAEIGDGAAGSGAGDKVFYLDDIRFTGEIAAAQAAPVMIRSYDTENIYIQNAAYSYDNALALMAFVSEDLQIEAKQLADAFVYAVNNDRAGGKSGEKSGGKRVRNAYAAGDIAAPPGWESGARLPGWYDNEKGEWLEDRYQVGSNVGNTSYVALALLQYQNRYGGAEYLEAAKAIMDWVLANCQDGKDGFTGGFDGWEEGDPPTVYPFTYKSIEHNIDAFAAFTQLYAQTGDSKYYDAAQSALRFVESMYDGKIFMTGTKDDGVTPNKDVVVLDAQVWSALAMGDDFEKYEKALKTVEKMKTDGGYPFCLENKNGGWWAEGTAYTALMYKLRGEEDKYAEAMEALAGIQLENGLFPAATVDNLSTGMDLFDGSPWEYSQDPHIAPAAWFVMAANGFNPYTFEDID